MNAIAIEKKKKRMTRRIEECFRLIDRGNVSTADMFCTVAPVLTTQELDETYSYLRKMMDYQVKAFRTILSEKEE